MHFEIKWLLAEGSTKLAVNDESLYAAAQLAPRDRGPAVEFQ